jgi:Glycosyl-transferase for dystroglycan
LLIDMHNELKINLQNHATHSQSRIDTYAKLLLESLGVLHQAWNNLETLNCTNMNYSNSDPGCSMRFQNAIPAPSCSVQTNSGSLRWKSLITLATHGGVSKLERLLIQTQWWGGPVSAAIYLNRHEDVVNFVKFASSRRQELANVTFHFLMETPEADGYPHNMLRNLALGSVTTDYVLLMDVDFITNPGAHNEMVDLIQHDADIYEKLRSQYVFALPPFGIRPEPGKEFATPDLLPRSKAEVLEGVQNETIFRFYQHSVPHVDRFHLYDTWYQGNHPLQYICSEYKFGVEPYVLAYRLGLPPYHEKFCGFGYDKVSWFWRLNYTEGYQIGILQDFYVSHLHHPEVTQSEHKKGLQRNSPIFEAYENDLRDAIAQQWIL